MIVPIPPQKPGISIIQTIARYFTDRAISSKIDEELDYFKEIIDKWHADYHRNIIVSVIFHVLTVLMTVIPYFFFSINNVVIIIVSGISIFMLVRFIYSITRSIVNFIIPYRRDILGILHDFVHYKSYTIAIKSFIRNKFSEEYENKTNGAIRFFHSLGSIIGVVKPVDSIEDDVVDEFYGFIRNYVIKEIAYKVITFLAYCAIFTFLLRPFVFSYAMKMNVTDVVFYPFVVALPSIIRIIKGWI